jgi:stage II sporulation protein D
MKPEYSYTELFGPQIRIGVLQHQRLIRFSTIGDYEVCDSGVQKRLELPKTKRHFTACVAQSEPASIGYRLAFLKTSDRTRADGALAKLQSSPGLGECEIITMGYAFSSEGEPEASSREYWVCSSPFASLHDAENERQRMQQRETIDIFAVRVRAPRGTLRLLLPSGEEELFETFARIQPAGKASGRIILHDVIVGVGFHWEHKEDQKFRGAMELRIDNRGLLTAVNELRLEEYLFSVNSSEMMSVCDRALLEAQTIAARNTILATMGKHHYADDFHLCADDHCQCYRGSSRETRASYEGALDTLGKVLVYGGKVCDARYSKMCGGIMEAYEKVWHGEPVAYMPAGFDGGKDARDRALFPADSEEGARRLISSSPDVYCNTTRGDVPVYLQYSATYFRWRQEYAREEFETLLNRFPEYRVGEVRDIVTLSRGYSGRIEYLKVLGSGRDVVIGREYTIRKVFSPSFLYSSCFVAEIERERGGRVKRIILHGAGWGHGAGLCQIGAAMMAHKGFSCKDILYHYYPNTVVALLFRGAIEREKTLAELTAEDFRVGDACFEFFNCYAVAQCPIYLQHKKIAATRSGEGFVFVQASDQRDNLEAMHIECAFLNFEGERAIPKT